MQTDVFTHSPLAIPMLKRTFSTLCLLLVLPTGGCHFLNSSHTPTKQSIDQDGPPSVKLDPTTLQDAVPKYEPRSRYGNHTPYTVLGKKYEVIETSRPLKQEGIASWYGTKFHGKRTSSWEPYDMFAMTGAHRSLPLPTYVKVTNLKNGASTVIKVNDRGPFHSERIIDLSYAAAVKLGFADAGTAPVRIEAIPMESLKVSLNPGAIRSAQSHPSLNGQQQLLKAKQSQVNQASAANKLFVQVGAYSEQQRAHEIKSSLSEWITFPISVTKSKHNGLYRVQIGPLRSTVQAQAINQLLAKEFKIESPLIVWN